MPSFILKVQPARDLYVEWSTIVDNVVRAGTRAEFLHHLAKVLAKVQPDLLTDPEHRPEMRMARAYVYGTSALPALNDHPRFGGWDSTGLMVEQRGILRRGDLLAYVDAMEADDPEAAYALLVPFADAEAEDEHASQPVRSV